MPIRGYHARFGSLGGEGVGGWPRGGYYPGAPWSTLESFGNTLDSKNKSNSKVPQTLVWKQTSNYKIPTHKFQIKRVSINSHNMNLKSAESI